MISLYYHELKEKIKEHEGEKYFMVDDYMVNKVLDKIQNIGIKIGNVLAQMINCQIILL